MSGGPREQGGRGKGSGHTGQASQILLNNDHFYFYDSRTPKFVCIGDKFINICLQRSEKYSILLESFVSVLTNSYCNITTKRFLTRLLQGRRDAPPQDGGGGGGQGGGGGGMEFDSWRHQTHQPPSAAFNHMSSTMDPYMSSFYGSQYFPGYGVGDGTWSNGGDPAMTFLGNYGQGMQVCLLYIHKIISSSVSGCWG